MHIDDVKISKQKSGSLIEEVGLPFRNTLWYIPTHKILWNVKAQQLKADNEK